MSEEKDKLTLTFVEEKPTPFAEWFEKDLLGCNGCQTPLEACNHLMKSAKETIKKIKKGVSPEDLLDMASDTVKGIRDSLLAKLQQDNLDAEHVRALCDWITSMLGQ